eukprot:EG_transcript_2605
MSPQQEPHNVATLLHLCRLWDAQQKKSSKSRVPMSMPDLLNADAGRPAGSPPNSAGPAAPAAKPAPPCAVVVVGRSHVFSMSATDTTACLGPSAASKGPSSALTPPSPPPRPTLGPAPLPASLPQPSPLTLPAAAPTSGPPPLPLPLAPSTRVPPSRKEVSPKRQQRVALKIMQELVRERQRAEMQTKKLLCEDRLVDILQSEVFDLLFSSFMDLSP